MTVKAQYFTLKNGKTVLLKSPEEADALALLLHTKKTAAETHFLVKTAAEAEKLSLEKEKVLINAVNESKDSFIIAAFLDGDVVASAEIDCSCRRVKTRHRASFGVAVSKSESNNGLGTLLTLKALQIAKEIGYTQVELGVYSDNFCAIHVYEKCGFKRYGLLDKSFRLEDGSFRAEVLMVKYL